MKITLVSRKTGRHFYLFAPRFVYNWMVKEWDKREKRMGL